MKKYFIPPEFKKYFEPLVDPTSLLPPPSLLVPCDEPKSEYHTYMFDTKVMKQLHEAMLPPEPAYTIAVYENLAKPARPFMRMRHQGRFEIHVPKKESDLEAPNGRGSLLASWLHELGHVIGYIFNLPATREDPRGAWGYPLHETSDEPVYSRVYHGEVEAWDVSEALCNCMRYRRECLASYPNPVDGSPIQHFRFLDEKVKS